jgi:protein-L-isoaspartate(D-aspartate) O-methyltransferase
MVVRIILIILSLIMVEKVLSQADEFSSARNNMVKAQIIDRGITNTSVLKAMRKVPRHLFVPKEVESDAYGDYPLPIGYGQTISQPYIVAYMTEVVKPARKEKVLEVGTGSGYQAAILAEILDSVYTIEIIPELAQESAARFKQLGYNNILAKTGDGYNGWQQHAPFDIIIVTAAATEVPKPLMGQLAENGRLVIPVGEPGAIQELILLVKKNGKIRKSTLTFVRFVPFLRSDN